MLRSKTLFIVGAGASKEASLPTGVELKSQIASLLDITQTSGDQEIAAALRYQARLNSNPQNTGPYFLAARQVRDAMPQGISIDNFIEAHSGNKNIEICAKLAIARAILVAETKSPLFIDIKKGQEKPRFNAIENTWYNKIFQMLTENLHKGEIENVFDNCSFVTFNYDRSIEHFFFHSLQNYYLISEAESARIINSTKIYHPYGKTGDLPWENREASIGFGGSPSTDGLLSLSRRIKTFSERIREKSAIEEIRNIVKDSETIVFLGFAFHKQNMELITPNEQSDVQRVFATAYRISDSDVDYIKKRIFKTLKFRNPRPHTNIRNDLTCDGLFGEYWRTL